jgi:hypothetical protein
MSEDIKKLCMEHGKSIASLITTVEATDKKVDLLLEDMRGDDGIRERMTVLETKHNTQPSPKQMVAYSTTGGSVAVLFYILAKKLASIF